MLGRSHAALSSNRPGLSAVKFFSRLIVEESVFGCCGSSFQPSAIDDKKILESISIVVQEGSSSRH